MFKYLIFYNSNYEVHIENDHTVNFNNISDVSNHVWNELLAGFINSQNMQNM